MEYEIIFDHRVIKDDLKSIGDTEKKRIVRDIGKKLKSASLDFGKPLQYKLKKLYSLRVGDYRVIYQIDQNDMLITILKIGHRNEVYDEVLKRLD